MLLLQKDEEIRELNDRLEEKDERIVELHARLKKVLPKEADGFIGTRPDRPKDMSMLVHEIKEREEQIEDLKEKLVQATT